MRLEWVARTERKQQMERASRNGCRRRRECQRGVRKGVERSNNVSANNDGDLKLSIMAAPLTGLWQGQTCYIAGVGKSGQTFVHSYRQSVVFVGISGLALCTSPHSRQESVGSLSREVDLQLCHNIRCGQPGPVELVVALPNAFSFLEPIGVVVEADSITTGFWSRLDPNNLHSTVPS